MTNNMSSLDRGLRAFVVAPVALVLAFIVGPGSIAGIVLFARDPARHRRRRLLPPLQALPFRQPPQAAAALTHDTKE
jgi:hypothetical protein